MRKIDPVLSGGSISQSQAKYVDRKLAVTIDAIVRNVLPELPGLYKVLNAESL